MTDLPPELQELNSRQRRAVINYANGMSKHDAYKLAGFNCSNDTSLDAAASDFFRKVRIKAACDALVERRDCASLAIIENTVASPLEVRQVLTKLLRSDLKNHINAQGEPELGADSVPVREYSHRRRIDREGNPVVSKEIKLESKLEAARELAKIHGMYAPSRHLVAQRVQFEIVHTSREKQGEPPPE